MVDDELGELITGTPVQLLEEDLLADICRCSFREFVQEFWDLVPGTQPLRWNWHLDVFCDELERVAGPVFRNEPRSHDTVLNVSPGTSKSTLWSILFPAWLWTRMPHCRIMTASHTDTLALDLANKTRELIRSEKYQQLFPEIIIRKDQDTKGYYANTLGGDRLTCTVAGKSPMGFHCHICIIDDPLDPKKAMSEKEVTTARHFVTEVIPSRKVDKRVSVTLLVMQRLGLGDPTDVMLEEGRKEGAAPVRHICLPAELLRGEDGTFLDSEVKPAELVSRYVNGLMDPVRLDSVALAEQRARGANYFCCPGFSPILMSNWTEKLIQDVQVGDEVVGFEVGVSCKRGSVGRSGIRKAIVTNKFKYRRSVVKLHMESGREVYCTLDHKWWTGEKTYAPALPGRYLFTVHESLDEITPKSKDKVLKISHVGEMDVYALETTTGNYVAWGYASSNSTQFLQKPYAKSGGMFHEEYFNQRVKASPFDAKRVIYVDRASTDQGGCWTAAVMMSKDKDANYYIEEVLRGQWEPHERNQKLRAFALRARSRYGPKNEPVIWVEMEGGSSGRDAWKGVAKALDGFIVREHNVSKMGNKQLRAEPWSSQLAARNVYVVDNGESKGEGRAFWDVASYVAEHCAFPLGRYLDQVDASSGAYSLLMGGTTPRAGLRVYTLGKGTGPQPRVVVCSREVLAHLTISHPVILLSISDPTSTPEIPPHGLERNLDQLVLPFADIDPADHQERWGEAIPRWGKPCEEVMMSMEQGKKLWSMILRKRQEPWEVLVIQDEGEGDRRGLSLAMGLCEVMRWPFKSSVYFPNNPEGMLEDYDNKDKLNAHIVRVVKASRAGVYG